MVEGGSGSGLPNHALVEIVTFLPWRHVEFDFGDFFEVILLVESQCHGRTFNIGCQTSVITTLKAPVKKKRGSASPLVFRTCT
jgi:hypothetical protein